MVFDRAGNKYHGRIAALADGAREGGLTLLIALFTDMQNRVGSNS